MGKNTLRLNKNSVRVGGDPSLLHIDELWAFLSRGLDGNEGVCGFKKKKMEHSNVFMTMVCADIERVNALRAVAKDMAEKSGMQVRLVKFSHREDLEIYG